MLPELKFSFGGKKNPIVSKIIGFKPLRLDKLIGIKLVIIILSITESSLMCPMSALCLVYFYS
jgi:hypothetical protein